MPPFTRKTYSTMVRTLVTLTSAAHTMTSQRELLRANHQQGETAQQKTCRRIARHGGSCGANWIGTGV
jgi:hypothetical protein